MNNLQLSWTDLEKVLSYLESVNKPDIGHSVKLDELKEHIATATLAALRCRALSRPRGDKMNFNEWNSLMRHFIALAKNSKADLRIKSNSLLTATFIFSSVPQVSDLYRSCI